MILIGVDTGGTFTDFIYQREDQTWGAYKLLSTPHNPTEAVIAGLEKILKGDQLGVVHGTTVATNAILERKGVKTAIITNQGFEDLIQIGRQNRTELYNLFYTKPVPIVPADLRFGLSGRLDCQGRELVPLSEAETQKLIKRIQENKVESVAICFLFSYLNPEPENRIAESLQKAGIQCSQSSKILPEFREFERLSTTVVNAYISPKMSGYLKQLSSSIGEHPFRVMQSNGGSISVQTAMEESVRTVLSGPAGGVVGAKEMGKVIGLDKIITFDMGGTSTDVCLIDGSLPLSLESSLSGYPLKVPMLDIHTVGAGGGSIADLDPGGALKVGPKSAGAVPGPICYGQGQDITVSDANLYLGRMIPEHFLGGNMVLHSQKLQKAFEQMSLKADLTSAQLAEGILDVANTNMEKAMRVISVERGFDPREFSLFSFGGAGGLHAAFLARLLSIPKVIIPKNPGILSALGMVMADVIKDYSQTIMITENVQDFSKIRYLFHPMEEQAVKDLQKEGFDREEILLEYYLDMRYKGQSFEIMVPFSQEYHKEFGKLHQKKYGYHNPDKNLEIVNLRLLARAHPQKPRIEYFPDQGKKLSPKAIYGQTKTIFDSQSYDSQILIRDRLLPGNTLNGPAILVEYTSTIAVPPFAWAWVDNYLNLHMEIEN